MPIADRMTSPPPRLVLASSSPRRRELLAEAGYEFIVVPPDEDVECGICSETGPAGLVAEFAYRKAAAVRQQLHYGDSTSAAVASFDPAFIVAADTIAECDGAILGKPRNEHDARTMLTRLSGRDHRVLSGVCVWPFDPLDSRDERPSPEPLVRVAITRLRMDELTSSQLDEYLAGGGWEGKAGAFGYQDRLGWVRIVEGSESNVVGLPMELLAEMLNTSAT